jgi:hypothetical protein
MSLKSKAITLLVGAVGLTLSHGFVYFKGQMDKEKMLAGKDLVTVVEAVKTKEKIDEKVSNMASPDIDRALADNGWMRRPEDI